MYNYTKFVKNNIINTAKYFFHVINILLIIFYLYPGSIFGCFVYNDCGIQPQLTRDFVSGLISSNHVYVFTIISIVGFIAYSQKKTFLKITIYLFFISIFLELAHLIVPERGFEIKDVAGNILGVAISLIIFLIIKLRKKNG
tara:strand:+ start:1591 stop:2016 length:426 start_codon:yes stop_codon:yes gene_type:complete